SGFGKHGGKTYSEIRRILEIPKSTLSDWLSNYPLTQKQKSILERNQKRNKDLVKDKVEENVKLDEL
ncbi:hypothetical protein M1545_01570, partial [Patescibacteria group bacterium]|nr:hypothetical protein [Patescibacteria group bacterium]